MSENGLDTSGTAWISKGFENLVDRVRQAPQEVHFDILIVGSGYGGAMAACTFAGRQNSGQPISVALLERGKEYLPGSFPKDLSELPGHIRLDQNKEGLFDIRLGPEVATVVANGLGGGSLINAGVMEVPTDEVFQTGWPEPLQKLSSWETFFDRARKMLGASDEEGKNNTILNYGGDPPSKYHAIEGVAPPGSFRPAAITVAMDDTESSGHVELNKCTLCGDCATGCNFGAKISLDLNLLVSAQQAGAHLYSGATVLTVEQDGANWIANCVYTNAALRARDGEVLKVRARRIILAAGTLGSSEILLRSHAAGLPVADLQLGQRCSTNGDMLVTDYATSTAVCTVADEAEKPSARRIGPTITGVIDLRATNKILVEEMSVPAALGVLFREVFATVNTLHSLTDIDTSPHSRGFPDDDIYAVPVAHINNTALYAVMADDGAAGTIELNGNTSSMASDGLARIRWDGANSLEVFDTEVRTLADLTKASGGRIIANPFWKLLPSELAWLLKDQRGPLITVHPLGGCAMANSGATGVVDDVGRVFSTNSSTAIHDGLVVLDGSIIPTALGTNPALTISAVTLRAAESLAHTWGFAEGAPGAPATPLRRPVFRSTDVAAEVPASKVEIIERLVGPVAFKAADSVEQRRVVELTLRFKLKLLGQLSQGNGADPILEVASGPSQENVSSQIRIFPEARWDCINKSWAPPHQKEKLLDAIAEFHAPLAGTLRVLERQKSSGFGRIWRAGFAWLRNRGWRDIYQGIADREAGPGLWSRIKAGIAVASRGGEIRQLVYDLTVGEPAAGAKFALDGSKIVGTKTFTYQRRCNPWRQLMEVKLETFPGLIGIGSDQVVKLDEQYLARIGVPLLRIVGQPDAVRAIAELITFFGYFIRLLLGLHIWSFRAPDTPKERKKRGVQPFPPPALTLSDGDTIAADVGCIAIPPESPQLAPSMAPPVAGSVRLTHYPSPQSDVAKGKHPVVMFHGYSAAGSTFAHHAVKPNLASFLCESGRDVWIADLRTSFGQPTAKEAWSFDQIGARDVPEVLQKVAASSFDGKVDVVAHCMGAVVFSIAVLGGHVKSEIIYRAALTQVGPLVVFSPANIFRAYTLKYLINFLPDNYSFNPDNPSLADDLWDRLLSTLPYPIEEFDIENPLWPCSRTPWTRTRHRMDALYGRAFNAARMEPKVLSCINDYFGVMSLKTVSTTLNFVRYSLMTDYRGQNQLVSRENFETYWKFPTFSVHGDQNGLAHISTADRMRQILGDAELRYQAPFINPDTGHQDALIGAGRIATFEKIRDFFDTTSPPPQTKPQSAMVAYPPWIGPIITEQRPQTPALVLRVGSLPSHRLADGVLMLRVTWRKGQILRPDDRAWDRDYIVNHMVVYSSQQLQSRWAAFEAPLPELMPGYQQGQPGNALLVLVCYGESSVLVTAPLSEASLAERPEAVAEDRERSAADASIVERRETATTEDHQRSAADAATRDGHFFAVADKATVYCLDPTRPNEEPPKANFNFDRFTMMADAALSALTTPTTGEGLRGTFLEQDGELVDGVIAYDPPANPAQQPEPNGTCFTVSSCQYPAGFVDDPVAYRSYHRILDRLDTREGPKPRFALFVGDQVYVDATAGLYDPSSQDDRYQLPYEAWLRQRHVRELLRRIPSFMLLDDHEIEDNWEPQACPDNPCNAKKERWGAAAYIKYQRGIGGGLETFVFDGFHFFMLDTRTERTHRKVGILETATLFGRDRMDGLKQWLLDSPGPKFIATPAMFLPRHRVAVQHNSALDSSNLSALHSDSWDGYPNTLREVLAFIAAHKIQGVVFLSGDEHRGSVAKADLLDSDGNKITRIHSIYTAAMYAPLPFANALDEDIVKCERIVIDDPLGRYTCVVEATRPPPGDGATVVFIHKCGQDWLLDYEFADGKVTTLTL